MPRKVYFEMFLLENCATIKAPFEGLEYLRYSNKEISGRPVLLGLRLKVTICLSFLFQQNFKSVFLNHDTNDILSQIILCCRGGGGFCIWWDV